VKAVQAAGVLPMRSRSQSSTRQLPHDDIGGGHCSQVGDVSPVEEDGERLKPSTHTVIQTTMRYMHRADWARSGAIRLLDRSEAKGMTPLHDSE